MGHTCGPLLVTERVHEALNGLKLVSEGYNFDIL